MSALRIRIGDYWWTGAPGEPQGVASSASSVAFGQVKSMTMLSGPEWEAQEPAQQRQKGVEVSFAVTRAFETVADVAAFLVAVMGLEPDWDWQDDIVLRWDHEDGEGYTESEIPWGALRVNNIEPEGPLTLRLSCVVLGPVLRDFALRSRPLIVTRAGEPIVTVSGRPLRAVEYVTVEAD